jgi:hypothetical protein
MRPTLAFGTFVLLNSAFACADGAWGDRAWADRGPSDEERIAPLVAAQGCWGGVITFVHDQRKFEVEGCRCSDAQKYHLEFDSDLKLIAKRLVR